jgi:hypothetical protein
MMLGLARLVRSRQRIWVTEQAPASLDIELPHDDDPAIAPNRPVAPATSTSSAWSRFMSCGRPVRSAS